MAQSNENKVYYNENIYFQLWSAGLPNSVPLAMYVSDSVLSLPWGSGCTLSPAVVVEWGCTTSTARYSILKHKQFQKFKSRI